VDVLDPVLLPGRIQRLLFQKHDSGEIAYSHVEAVLIVFRTPRARRRRSASPPPILEC
jgi:hypothetical protein